MKKLERIFRDVETIAPDELVMFRAWFAEFDAAQWDAQIEADIEAGKLNKLAEKALADQRAGLGRLL